MFVAANAALADGVRSAGSKVRADYDAITSLVNPRTRTVYRAMAPAAVAQTPDARRSFSAEPTQRATSPCQTAPPSAPMAQRPAQAQRRYSYEPSYGTMRVAPSRGFRSQAPAYLLQKTDERKYRGF
jgi:hypothetical protein